MQDALESLVQTLDAQDIGGSLPTPPSADDPQDTAGDDSDLTASDDSDLADDFAPVDDPSLTELCPAASRTRSS